MPQNKPLYIVFEGGDGSGKSTQARLLASRIGALTTFEPGATGAGAMLRQILLSPDTGELDASTELLLMAADRHQTMAEIIRPNLAEGRTVISDRSFISSLAYQGAGRKLGIDAVLDLNLRLGKLLMPDLVFLIDPPSKEEQARRDKIKGRFDKIEAAQDGFHLRVAEAFGQMANTLAADSRTEHITVIPIGQEGQDGQQAPGQINDMIYQTLVSYCEANRLVVPSP